MTTVQEEDRTELTDVRSGEDRAVRILIASFEITEMPGNEELITVGLKHAVLLLANHNCVLNASMVLLNLEPYKNTS